MRRETTKTRSTREAPSAPEPAGLRVERLADGKTVFNDPVAYLQSLGIQAELVEETVVSLVPAA